MQDRLRLRREIDQLRLAFPQLRVASDLTWVCLPDFQLPAGWQPDRTTLLIEPAPNHPEAAPLGFHLAARLRRCVGGVLEQPGHYFRDYHNRYADRGWYWYCLEDMDRAWDPRWDSLVTFVEAIRTYLGTVD